ncbi:MAG: DUF3386 family protein [Abitibacteriaceae bacterium]|nr:DUF3386 family protein [Abditibacteriaceae bacterium]
MRNCSIKTQLIGLSLLSLLLEASIAAAAPAPPNPAPLGVPPKADAAAYALLQAAHDSRQVLPPTLTGIDATIVYTDGAKTSTGTLHYRTTGQSVLDFNGLAKDDKDWLEDQVFSIMGHRTNGDFAHGDGRYPLTFGAAPDNSFGKLIELHDGMESSYRVRGHEITEVTRTGGDTRFTISVIQTRQADAGKYLPIHFMVAYRDKKTGALQQVEGFRDSYAKIGDAWLPRTRMVITFDKSTSPRLRQIEFRDIKLLAASANPAP